MEFLLSALLTGLILAIFQVNTNSAIFNPLAVILFTIILIPMFILFDSLRNRINQYIRRKSYLAGRNLRRNRFLFTYIKRLKKYYKSHDIRFKLKNDNVILKVYKHSQDVTSFYCLNKKSEIGYLERLNFSSQKDANLVMIFWTILDMEFNKDTTFDKIFELAISAQMGNFLRRIENVKPIKGKTYDLQYISQEKPYLCCYKKIKVSKSSKGSKKNSEKRKYPQEYFLIKADLENLYDIYIAIKNDYRNTDYEELYNLLSKRQDCEVENFVYTPKENITLYNLIDINNASEVVLSKLSGVNIILAKRIIKHREYINGFKSKEDFLKFCNLKPHFIKQMEPLIVVGEFDIIDVIFKKDERIVDVIDENMDYTNDNNNNDAGDNIIVDF